MPFPNDDQLMATAKGLVEQLKSIFHTPGGFRPAHAKGTLLSGTFTSTPLARTLSTAPHLQSASPIPITVRFSNSTGLPSIPDTDANADPRGIAVRFHLGGRAHTDIICHSTPTFPTRTGAEFLTFLRAIAAGTAGEYIGSHPAALAHVQYPKPAPESFATEQYWGVTAFKLLDKDGRATFVRWHVVPDAGVKTLSEEEVKGRGSDYLTEDLKTRQPFTFKWLAQVAAEGDVTDDATVRWPEDREEVELGTFSIDGLVEDPMPKEKYIIFDPIPRVQGVEPSDDPLLEMRAAVYLISGRDRRAA